MSRSYWVPRSALGRGLKSFLCHRPLLPEWRYWPAVILGVLLLVAVAGVMINSGAPQSPHQIAATSGTTTADDDGNKEENKIVSAWRAFWGWTTKDAVSFYTFVLAIFTAALAGFSVFQITFLIRADRTARISANAAKRAAESLPALERAYIFFVRETTTALSDAARGFRTNVLLLMHLSNAGRTPAIVASAKSAIAVCAAPDEVMLQAHIRETLNEWIIPANTTAEPEAGDYSRSFHAILHHKEWESREHKSRDEPNNAASLTEDEYIAIRSKTKFIWAWCEISYKDVFGEPHATAFLLRVNPETYAVESFGGDKWNYRT